MRLLTFLHGKIDNDTQSHSFEVLTYFSKLSYIVL
jgi:hypothetical protein